MVKESDGSIWFDGQSVCLSVYLSIRLSVLLFVQSLSVFSRSSCLSVHTMASLSIRLSVCLSIQQDVFLPSCLSSCPPVSPSDHSSVCLTINLTFISFVLLSVCVVFIAANYLVTGDCSCLVVIAVVIINIIIIIVAVIIFVFIPDIYSTHIYVIYISHIRI